MVDKDAPHHVRSNRKEMCPVLPPDLSLVDQLQVRLVDKSGGRERVPALQATSRSVSSVLCVMPGLRPVFISELLGMRPFFLAFRVSRYAGIVARCGSQEATHDAYRKSDRIATVDRDIVLSPDGGNLTSNDVARFRDLAGNLLGSRCAAVTGTRLNGRADLIREIEEYVAHNRHAGTLDLDCLRGDDRPKGASP